MKFYHRKIKNRLNFAVQATQFMFVYFVPIGTYTRLAASRFDHSGQSPRSQVLFAAKIDHKPD